MGGFGGLHDENQMKQFGENYRRYFEEESKLDMNKIRKLEKLAIYSEVDEENDVVNLLCNLSPNYKELLLHGGSLLINDLSHVAKIFHPNLQKLTLYRSGDNRDANTLIRLNDDISINGINTHGSNIKEFEINVRNIDSLYDANEIFDQFNKFNLLTKMEKLIVTWNWGHDAHSYLRRWEDNDIRDSFFNCVCNGGHKYGWHNVYPHLKTITMRFNCFNWCHLLEEAVKICDCLYVCRDVIKNKSNIQCVEFEWNLCQYWNDLADLDYLDQLEVVLDNYKHGGKGAANSNLCNELLFCQKMFDDIKNWIENYASTEGEVLIFKYTTQ